MFQRYILICVMMLSVVLAHEVRGAEIQEAFQSLSARILEVTDNQPVVVGVFSETGLAASNSGPGLEEMLVEELNKKQNGCVQANAKFIIKGDYAYVRVKKDDDAPRVIKLNIRVIDAESSEEITSIPVTLDHNKSIAEVLQVTASLPKSGTKLERNQVIQEAYQNPQPQVGGAQKTIASSNSSSEYGVEILSCPLQAFSSNQMTPCPIELENGNPYVQLNLDDVYVIKIHNHSEREVAVSLKIDGIDFYHFSKDRVTSEIAHSKVEIYRNDASYQHLLKEELDKVGNPLFTHVIVKPKSQHTILGWHNSLKGKENFLSFLVTAYGKGASLSAGISSRGQIGVIHCQFSECFPIRVGSLSRSGVETGFGPPRESTQKAVHYEIEPPHDFVSIRYAR